MDTNRKYSMSLSWYICAWKASVWSMWHVHMEIAPHGRDEASPTGGSTGCRARESKEDATGK